MRRERIALTLLLLILVVMPLVALGYQQWLRPVLAPNRVIDVIAAVPETGGFQPKAISVSSGETVTLRFSSTDVTHGIAIGPGLGIDLGHVDPGHVVEVTLTFDRAGTYTFYCNTWCSPNHWRMRGVLEVYPVAGQPTPTPFRDPVIEVLAAQGVDIDAEHGTNSQKGMDGMTGMGSGQTSLLTLTHRLSAVRGAALASSLVIPSELRALAWRRAHTPRQGLELLTQVNPQANPSELIHVVAYLWTSHITSETLKGAIPVYNNNCAACHGQTGDGKGPMASLTIKPPASFTDLAHMFDMRSDVLYAKIRRGGMGTDMPNFGTVFTPEETWALVDYLWTLNVETQEGK
jgi:plastocyanin